MSIDVRRSMSGAEGITVSDLAQRAELDIAQTSRAIGTLAREGYLKRVAQVQCLGAIISTLRNTAKRLKASGRDVETAMQQRARLSQVKTSTKPTRRSGKSS
jgi:DNA-binding IclR family transcriptional regulator